MIVIFAFVAVSVVLTLLAFARMHRKVEDLKAGRPAVAHSWVGRMIDVVVPDRVMLFSYPRMSQVMEYAQLTGEQVVSVQTHIALLKRKSPPVLPYSNIATSVLTAGPAPERGTTAS